MSFRLSILLLILLNLAVFVQATRFEFISLDDDRYVTENSVVRIGLTLPGIAYAFSTDPAPIANPLALVSHMLDVEVFALNSGGHHLSSLVLHIANTILLFAVLVRATGAGGASLLIAALFAVHPLHVETVVWVAERKGLLSAFLFLGTIAAYVEYARSRRLSWLALSTGVYALSLLAGPMSVTLPFVLLLFDRWPLDRVRNSRTFYALVLEKIPLFVLSALSCFGTWHVLQSSGAAVAPQPFSIYERLLNAFGAYGMYLRQVIWPFDLNIYYPFPASGGGALFGAAMLLLLAVLAGSSLTWRHRMPWIFTGVFWFIGMLVPVVGLVHLGSHLHADRYTYLPVAGLFIAIVFTASDFLSRRALAQRARGVAYAAATVLVAVLAVRAFQQASLWRNSEVLLTHALNTTGETMLVRNSLGDHYLASSQFDEAEKQYLQSEVLHPGHFLPTYSLAYMAHRKGDYANAIRRLLPLVEDHPADVSFRLLLADSHLRADQPDEAIAHALVARELDAKKVAAPIILGLSYEKLGRWDDAHDQFLGAAQDFPHAALAQVTLANFFARSNDFQSAMPYYQRALALAPYDATIHYNLGVAYEQSGAFDEAMRSYKEAIMLNPFMGNAQSRFDALSEQTSVPAMDPGINSNDGLSVSN